MHVFGWVCACTCVWRPKTDAGSLSWTCSFLLTHWGRVSQLNTELTDSACLISQQDEVESIPCLYLLRVGIIGGLPHPSGNYVGSRDLNSGPVLVCQGVILLSYLNLPVCLLHNVSWSHSFPYPFESICPCIPPNKTKFKGKKRKK